MTKILILITSLGEGGAERVASELSLNLSPNIQRIIVILKNDISYPTNKPPLCMNFNFKNRKLTYRIMRNIYAIIKYRKLIKKYKPNISLSLLTFNNFINIISNIGNKNTKVIISIHNALSMSYSNSLKDRFWKFLIKILYNKSDLVIAVSRGVREELIRDFKIFPDKIKMIYNPVDIEKIKHLAEEEVNDEFFNGELPIIINMGRLTKQKGQWHLIRCFSNVRKIIQCKLVIRGNGELKPYLEKLVRDLDLTNDVKFLGWQDNPFKYISKASIFVSSSLWEGLHYALIEAMVCGCPVISTDCNYGPSEILDNGKFGILIPSMDGKFYEGSDPLTPEEYYLANQIIRLLEDDGLRMRYSEKARKRANDFDKKIVKEYDNIMQQLISEG